MNEHQNFANNLSNTLIKSLSYGGGEPEQCKQVMLHAIYGYVAMKLPARVSFTFINQACQDTDIWHYDSLSDRILSIIEQSLIFEPVEINVVTTIDKTKLHLKELAKSMLRENTYKIKLPPYGSPELAKVYDFIFNEVHAGWAGISKNYAYSDSPSEVAPNQDGFLYCFYLPSYWRVTADSNHDFAKANEAMELDLTSDL